MSMRFFFGMPMPKSLRKQFTLAMSAPALLIIAAGLISFYDSLRSTNYTRQLAEVRMVYLRQAQDLVRCTLLIERESNRLIAADAFKPLQASYLEILHRIDLLDSLVLTLGHASTNLSVLALNQAGQLFRNSVHIVAQLQKNLLANKFAPPESDRQKEILIHFSKEFHRQAVSLVEATGRLSSDFTLDYIEAMRQVTTASESQQRREMILIAGSILLAWLIFRLFLARRVVERLQIVSNCLRLEETCAESTRIPVRGNDEIGDMARAVEQFLEDRRLLFQTQQDLRQKVDEIQDAFNEIKTLRGIIPICSSCKKIRDDKGYWNQIELYIKEHSDADFSHGICPDCVKKLYPDMDDF